MNLEKMKLIMNLQLKCSQLQSSNTIVPQSFSYNKINNWQEKCLRTQLTMGDNILTNSY